MPIDFPNSPVLNEEYTTGGRTWKWNGSVWLAIGTSSPVQGLTGLQGAAQGVQGLQGTQGTQGFTGAQGLVGAQGVAPRGIQGTEGSRGAISTNISLLDQRSGQYYAFGLGASQSITLTEDVTYYSPFFVKTSTTYDRIAYQHDIVSGGNVVTRLGIYNNDYTTYKPSTLVVDAGTLTETSAGFKTMTINQTLSAGWYWLALNMQSFTATTRTYRGRNTGAGNTNTAIVGFPLVSDSDLQTIIGYYETSVTGAFTTAGTLVESTLSNVHPAVLLRKA